MQFITLQKFWYLIIWCVEKLKLYVLIHFQTCLSTICRDFQPKQIQVSQAEVLKCLLVTSTFCHQFAFVCNLLILTIVDDLLLLVRGWKNEAFKDPVSFTQKITNFINCLLIYFSVLRENYGSAKFGLGKKAFRQLNFLKVKNSVVILFYFKAYGVDVFCLLLFVYSWYKRL